MCCPCSACGARWTCLETMYKYKPKPAICHENTNRIIENCTDCKFQHVKQRTTSLSAGSHATVSRLSRPSQAEFSCSFSTNCPAPSKQR